MYKTLKQITGAIGDFLFAANNMLSVVPAHESANASPKAALESKTSEPTPLEFMDSIRQQIVDLGYIPLQEAKETKPINVMTFDVSPSNGSIRLAVFGDTPFHNEYRNPYFSGGSPPQGEGKASFSAIIPPYNEGKYPVDSNRGHVFVLEMSEGGTLQFTKSHSQGVLNNMGIGHVPNYSRAEDPIAWAKRENAARLVAEWLMDYSGAMTNAPPRQIAGAAPQLPAATLYLSSGSDITSTAEAAGANQLSLRVEPASAPHAASEAESATGLPDLYALAQQSYEGRMRKGQLSFVDLYAFMLPIRERLIEGGFEVIDRPYEKNAIRGHFGVGNIMNYDEKARGADAEINIKLLGRPDSEPQYGDDTDRNTPAVIYAPGISVRVVSSKYGIECEGRQYEGKHIEVRTAEHSYLYSGAIDFGIQVGFMQKPNFKVFAWQERHLALKMLDDWLDKNTATASLSLEKPRTAGSLADSTKLLEASHS